MKDKKNLKLIIGIGVILLVILGIFAGFQALKGPIDIRNRAAEGGACFQDTLPVINCKVYYTLKRDPQDPGPPPAAQGKVYILNELGTKVHFNGGLEEQQVALPPGDHSTDPVIIPFEKVVTKEYFLDPDPNKDGKADAICKLENVVVPDECCKVDDGNGGKKIAESCLGAGEGKSTCGRTKISGCEGKVCACKDIIQGVTRYPTYHPRQPGIDDGKIILPPPDPKTGDVFCINCSRIELKDKKTGKVIKAFPTATPDPAKPGANACINDNGKDVEKEQAIEFRCHQGDVSDSEGCREYELEIENITKKLQCDDPADEPPPTEELTCKVGCKSCCPICTDPQPMWVERKLCTPKAGMEDNARKHPGDPSFWDCTVDKDKACSDNCNIDFNSPAIDNFNPGGFVGGNEQPQKPPGRGYPSNDQKGPTCIDAGKQSIIQPTIQPGSEGWINWDEFDFGAGKPVPTEKAGRSNNNQYEDPGVYDISLTCKLPDDVVEICTKRIAVTCPGSPPPPPPPPPPPGDLACYDSCDPLNSKCPTGMSCTDIGGGTAPEFRCIQYPDNDCADLPDGEKQACYCSEPTPQPPGSCKAQVKASCAPLQ